MAEIKTEKQICRTCGVDVRPDTLFCYNCGSAVGNFPTVKDKLLEEEQFAGRESEKISAAAKETKLTSAASLRQKKNSAPKKTVEVVWEEPQSASNVWFLVVAFLLTIFAVGIFAAMLYIR